MLVRDARASPAVAVGPQAASLALAAGGAGAAAAGAVAGAAAGGPWPVPPPSPLRTHPASVRLWGAHADAALPWLRVHDAGVRALPSLERPDLLPGVGVLIEPRRHGDTEFVLRNWAHFAAPQGWGLVIVHGPANAAWVRELTAGWPNVRLVDCGAADLPLPAYQRLLTDAAFWRQFTPYRRVVVFQTDTAQLGGGGGLARFAEYDYVGAPWANTCCLCGALILRGAATCCGHMIDHRALQRLAPELVGNGGLSLRSPAAMVEACERFCLAGTPPGERGAREPLPDCTNEDVFAATALLKLGKRVAPRAVASTFAIEEVTPLVLDPATPPAVGIHKPWAYQPPDVMQCILASVLYVDAATGDTCRPTPPPA